VTVRFVDIGGIDGYPCLIVLKIIILEDKN
jgi:hypothetical protein